MNKTILSILSLIFLIITSCEEEPNTIEKNGSITIESPYEDYQFIYIGQSLEIIAKINNKDQASSAYISVNNDIVASGLSDTLTAYYEPNSNINQNAIIEATLVNEENQIISSDNINISINTIDSNTLNSESIFMNINNEFMMMRAPVTNRQFMNFLNTNQQLNIDVVDILWTDIAIGDDPPDGYGDPNKCEFDEFDNYEPKNWWYVNVTSNYANDNIPAGEYTIYKNAYNIYDSNADYSDEAGRIRYNCQTGIFYMPLEDDGSESIYLDHPVVGVSWIGANVYANYFGWSLPTMEQWNLAAQGNPDENWIYPWAPDTTINQTYANYNNDNTSQIKYYNGLGELNLSTSAYGLYDMAGNVWEYTSTSSGMDAYKKTGGAFDSESYQLEIGYEAYALWEHVSYNTGFRCIANIDYISSPPSGCMNQEACNYDIFSELSSDCFEDDCLNICGGNNQEFEFFQDLDGDGFGNPEISEIQCNMPELGWTDNFDDIDDNCFSANEQTNFDCNQNCNGTDEQDECGACVELDDTSCVQGCDGIWANDGTHLILDQCGICGGGDATCQDCFGVVNGEAYIDGCGECVGGNTGIEPCPIDCNGIDGGTAFIDQCEECVNEGDTSCVQGCDGIWENDGSELEFDECGICDGDNSICSDCNGDPNGSAEPDDCDVCSGGLTGHEANSDQDCNGDCFGAAYIDSCNVCSGGNSGHEAESDLDDCGVCFGNGYQNYCIDANQNGCCDCGNDGNANWEECEQDAILSLCDSEVVDNYHIPIYTGCSYQYAENFYCNQEEEGCESFGANEFPSCNFIDDGSCIIHGCEDENANNTVTCQDIGGDSIDCNGTVICDDGNLDSCCVYPYCGDEICDDGEDYENCSEDCLEPVLISIGNINGTTMEILIDTPHDVGGFQFNIIGPSLGFSNGSGGLAADNGFTVSTGGSIVIGFSLSGSTIPAGSLGVLTNLTFEGNALEACLELGGTGAISDVNGIEIPVNFGDDTCSD